MYNFTLILYFYTIMKGRTQRLVEIKKIISTYKISSQDELLNKLKGMGISFTQATLSRDLKFLKVSRVITENGEYVYKLPSQLRESESEETPIVSQLGGFISLEFSSNLGVMRTKPGHAPSIALTIDDLNLFEILGTIAGDDTIMIIARENVSKQDIINGLALAIPGLTEKL